MKAIARIAIAFAALALAGSHICADDVQIHDVRIGILGLFHPRQFTVSAVNGNAIAVHTGQETFILEKSSGVSIAEIRTHGSMMAVRVGSRIVHVSEITVTGRESGTTDFLLAIPGKITRHYRGTLELKPSAGVLVAVVRMDLETAVASVVAAESLPGMPLEALKAQAIATRSYFVAGKGRHSEFDFCDTTHCQFLREPPGPGSATEATTATRGLVMVYRSHPFAAMYTRSCSGRTLTPADVGLDPGNYPYYSVVCQHCREHPSHWQSRISTSDAATLRSSDEASRLKIDRRLGWSTAPSNSFTMRKEDGHVILMGVGQGHGIGLCQSGARAMAEEGANYRQILSHYYPNASIVSLGLEPVAVTR
jgi:stage II sporulation protein D